jgi:putative spermidine/putrescine transport system permease protein
MAGLAFRRRFAGAGLVFYMAIASLIMPGLFVSLGIGLVFQMLGVTPTWYGSALGRAYEEAASDLGASNWQRLRHVTLPIVLPGIIGVALFGFTLSYDEFPRTVLTSGSSNTLPLEIWAMTTDVTSPALFAVGTVTTVISFIVIGLALTSIALIERRRLRRVSSLDESSTVG